jgi:matrixin/IPT/TIG domain-containing protein
MSGSRVVRLAALVATGFLLANTALAHYYYTYFNSTSPPYTPIVARFDLTTLSNNTVPFFVSSSGPSTLYQGDSVASMVSQISAAANVWNGVGTSSLRLAYGGFFNPGTTESAPGIQIEFSDDIPPGLLAFTIPTVVGNLATGPNGTTFLPIYLSLMELPSDMTSTFNGPSYSEEFFITLVHEFGHAMGLQHTLASSVMSTIITSASTKANPLGDDDVAGISLLYPSAKYLSNVGSISGTVKMNGRGVNLASVVAISPSNQAIATLTNPDGTYQLNGVPPGVEYYVYVHPLPAPVEGESSANNIWLPLNSAGNYLAPNTGFATQFYPGTLDQTQAQVITVAAGKVYPTAINFNVNPVSSPGVSSVETYSYFEGTYIRTAPILFGETTPIAVTGAGLVETVNASTGATVPTPGLTIGMLGTAAQITNLRVYPPPNQTYVAVDAMPTLPRPGPEHLLFSTPGNLYVLPAGFSVVLAPPPVISALAPAVDGNGNPAVAIAGQQFTSSTQVWFDGLPATIQSQTGTLLIVTPPAGPSGYTAAVAAFNSDGQSSLFLNATAPTYTYAPDASSSVAGNPSLVVSPGVIPAGSSLTLDVQGANTDFGTTTTVGFGTSDVQVNQINVISPTHLTVTVTPNVTISSTNITVTTGLELISQAVGSQISAADPQSQQ